MKKNFRKIRPIFEREQFDRTMKGDKFTYPIIEDYAV